MSSLEKLLGSTLGSRNGEFPTHLALGNKRVVGLYFTMKTCHLCHKLTPILATVYRNKSLPIYRHLGIQRELDVVMVSFDNDPIAFHDHLLQLPFWAVPFRRRDIARELKTKYEVKTIPTLIFVDENGNDIEREGRRVVEDHYTDLRKIWEHLVTKKQHLQEDISMVAE